MAVASRTPQEGRTLEDVRDYYGRVLKTSRDLKTGACCTPEALPEKLREVVGEIHPEVVARFYGCGVPIPPALPGLTVLDLGCGTGRDAFLLSRLVGEDGRVIGVDMTEEQLSIAEGHRAWHAERFGFQSSNVEFRKGYIEDLESLGIDDESVDLVVSNCVFNLSPDKLRLFTEILRVLKPGGELYFSDVFGDRRIPEHLKADPILLGECLAGALYTEDFRRLLSEAGCADVRQISSGPIPLLDPEVEARIGMLEFSSRTFRAFKLELEDRCEDYGQVATYLGTLEEDPHVFELDDHHRLEVGRPIRVCGNTAEMLSQTRYARHFRVEGDRSVHFGLFECAPSGSGTEGPANAQACC